MSSSLEKEKAELRRLQLAYEQKAEEERKRLQVLWTSLRRH